MLKNALIFNKKIGNIQRMKKSLYLVVMAAFSLLFAEETKEVCCKETIPTTLEVRFSYFWPQSQIVRDIYQGGGVDYQLTGTVPVYQGDIFALRGLNFWWAVDYFPRDGKSVGLDSGTSIQIEPLTAGFKWIYPESRIRPYLGVGFKYYFVQIHNDSPYVQSYIADNGPGCVAETGCQIFVAKYFFVDMFVAYSFKQFGSSSVSSPHVITTWLDLSGVNAGAGIGVKF